MKLPAGTQGGVAFDPNKEDMLHQLRAFKGVIEIENELGKGFLLMRGGELIAARFEDKEGVYRGDSAIRFIMAIPEGEKAPISQKSSIRSYTGQEYAEALDMCLKDGLLIGPSPSENSSFPDHGGGTGVSRTDSNIINEGTLNKILNQPGVIAVSAFYEGFPVLSLGKADFEHVAARAEDLLRAGTKIAQDMNLGDPDQLILETGKHKFIIVPCGDLFLGIITHADAQLGLMRVLIRSIQNDIRGGS